VSPFTYSFCFLTTTMKRVCLTFLHAKALLPCRSAFNHISTGIRALHTTHQTENVAAGASIEHSYLDPTNAFISTLDKNESLAAASHLGLSPKQNRFCQPIVYHPDYSFKTWPSQHTFPMSKFYYLSKYLLEKQDNLPRPLVRSEVDFFQPLNTNEIPRSWLAQPSGPISPLFLDRFLSASLDRKEELRIGFREFSKMHELRERTLLEVAGTVLAAQLAWRYGMATNAAGGTHHAHADMGAGYTIINDLAVAANFLLDEDLNGGTVKGVEKVLVIDCDVHQ